MSGRDGSEGFTLIELMVVVLIIGILVSICLPVFSSVKANAERKTCFSNERLVEGAYAQYISLNPGLAVTDWSTLMSRLIPNDLVKAPHCNAGGQYSFDGDRVTCSIHGSYR